MNLESVQDSIVSQLNAVFSHADHSALRCKAEKLPENDDEYKRAIKKNIAFVSITGSTSLNKNSTQPTIQERTLQVGIIIHCRSLYGPDGLFSVQDGLEKALIGFRPLHCERLYHVKDERDRELETNTWMQVFQFECTTKLVQDIALTETTYGNLKSVSYNPSTFNGS